MAATAMALQLRPKHRRTIRNPSFIHFFSSSSPSGPDVEDQNNASSSPSPTQSEPSVSSYFSDVKASLKHKIPQQRPRKQFSFSSTTVPAPAPSPSQTPSKVASLEEIRKNLSEFRRRSAVPTPENNSTSAAPSHPISFQELYKRNVISKGEGSRNDASEGGRLSFDAIRESLRQLRANASKNQVVNNDPMSLSKFKESLKLRAVDPNARDSTFVIGGSDKLPESVFKNEMKRKQEAESPALKTEFVKMYSYGELGQKLRKLRPEAKRENWFSLEELNERLIKLREMEEKETESSFGGVTFRDLRDSLVKMQASDAEKAKKQAIQRLEVLHQLGGTPDFMLSAPKEHLVEKYFHPDNMSSSEKLKLELQKVRDEFKMSESDCGSARVQVAQLTTKIKHLSTVLHKKDTHSRKGLQAMVQNRKKLLKYLRRTDWDSYCLVLSKLGLRDNPDYKSM